MKPGIYRMSAEEYHADPAPPSLSASIAAILCRDTPLHAWAAHPALNPTAAEEKKEHFDLGSICHSLLLEGIDIAVRLPFPDWRKDVAKEARAKVRAEGKIPILENHWPDVEGMILAARVQLDNHRDCKDAFTDAGEAECVLVWEDEGGITCRARLDWLHSSRKRILDYKTTGITANPEVISRTMFSNGWDVQAAFYCRGVKAIFGTDPSFYFVSQETLFPYALSVIGLGPDVMMLAEKKIQYAIEKWRECLDRNQWPGFPQQTCYATLPEWEEQKWLRKELGD